MHLLGKCFESGWDDQDPVPTKAIEAHTRAARCGDPQSLSWLQQQPDFNNLSTVIDVFTGKRKKNWKFYIAKQTRVEDHFEIDGLLDWADYSCNLKRHYTFYWYILKPIGFTIQLAFLPLCIFSNGGCPLLESRPSYPNYEPPPYLMGKFDR
jgi:hypothetical protein